MPVRGSLERRVSEQSMNDNALNGSHLHPRSDAVAPGVGIEPTRRAGQKVVYVASSEGTRPLVGRSLFSDVGGEDASSQIRGPPVSCDAVDLTHGPHKHHPIG